MAELLIFWGTTLFTFNRNLNHNLKQVNAVLLAIPRKDFLCIQADKHTLWLLFLTVLELLLLASAPSHWPRQQFKIWDCYLCSEEGGMTAVYGRWLFHSSVHTSQTHREPVFVLCLVLLCPCLFWDLLQYLYFVQLKCSALPQFWKCQAGEQALFSFCKPSKHTSIFQIVPVTSWSAWARRETQMQFKNTRMQNVKWSPWKMSVIAFVNYIHDGWLCTNGWWKTPNYEYHFWRAFTPGGSQWPRTDESQ